jgi:hypothetical protein
MRITEQHLRQIIKEELMKERKIKGVDAIQRVLGMPDNEIDSDWGKDTETAWDKFIDAYYKPRSGQPTNDAVKGSWKKASSQFGNDSLGNPNYSEDPEGALKFLKSLNTQQAAPTAADAPEESTDADANSAVFSSDSEETIPSSAVPGAPAPSSQAQIKIPAQTPNITSVGIAPGRTPIYLRPAPTGAVTWETGNDRNLAFYKTPNWSSIAYRLKKVDSRRTRMEPQDGGWEIVSPEAFASLAPAEIRPKIESGEYLLFLSPGRAEEFFGILDRQSAGGSFDEWEVNDVQTLDRIVLDLSNPLNENIIQRWNKLAGLLVD